MGHELKRIEAQWSLIRWNADALIKAPDYVREAHQNFIDAGAELTITNVDSCVSFDLGRSSMHSQVLNWRLEVLGLQEKRQKK